MLCERCGKNEATIHYSEIVNGKKRSYSLCEECADALGINVKSDPFEAFGAGSLLSGFFGDIFDHPAVGRVAEPKTETRCPVCGSTLREIAAKGKVGCAECYRTFRAELAPTIRKIHGGVTYKGTTPAADGTAAAKEKPASELDALRAELYEAIKNEEFERAAELRDKIKSLEN